MHVVLYLFYYWCVMIYFGFTLTLFLIRVPLLELFIIERFMSNKIDYQKPQYKFKNIIV